MADKLRVVGDAGAPLRWERAFTRGSTMFLQRGTALLRVDVTGIC